MARQILFVGNYPPPYGGVPVHIEKLADYLQAQGWGCHVLSGGDTGNQRIGNVQVYKPGFARKVRALARPALGGGIAGWLEGGSFATDEKALWRRYRMYADVGREIVAANAIDLIASYNLLSYAPIGAWLARDFGLPHVISNFGEVFKFDAMQRNKAFFGHVAGRATRLLSCSQHCGDSLRLLGIETPVHAVTYGVNLEHFSPGRPSAALRTRHGMGDGPVVLFVGRLSREMGLDTFMTAAAAVRAQRSHVRFVIVGQDGDLADTVAQQCRDRGDGYTLVRNAPYDELPDYYRLADILVVPTRGARTCSSLAAMEAMATRVAVVGFAIGGVPEIVAHERTGLLAPPEDVAVLGEAIVRILDDRVLRDALADAGHRFARENLDERAVSATMERHFLAALDGG